MSAVPATSQRARVRGQPTGDQTKTKCNSSSNTKPTDANMDPSRNTSRLINETNKKQQARTTAKPKRPDEHETTPDASAQVKSQRESWDSAESLFWDHLEEVEAKWATLKMNDDIWAKLIYFERNRRLAKAYVSAPVLSIDGSTMGLDGFRIGLSGIENPHRTLDSMACLRSIGRGIKLRIDSQGNILMRRNEPASNANPQQQPLTSAEKSNSTRSSSSSISNSNSPASSAGSIFLKRWPSFGSGKKRKSSPNSNSLMSKNSNGSETASDCSSKDSSSGSSRETPTTSQELLAGQALKLFDMRKFRLKLELERAQRHASAAPPAPVDWRQCVSLISFVQQQGQQHLASDAPELQDSLLEDSCWLMIINIIAMDMLKLAHAHHQVDSASWRVSLDSQWLPFVGADPVHCSSSQWEIMADYSDRGSNVLLGVGANGDGGRRRRDQRPVRAPALNARKARLQVRAAQTNSNARRSSSVAPSGPVGRGRQTGQPPNGPAPPATQTIYTTFTGRHFQSPIRLVDSVRDAALRSHYQGSRLLTQQQHQYEKRALRRSSSSDLSGAQRPAFGAPLPRSRAIRMNYEEEEESLTVDENGVDSEAAELGDFGPDAETCEPASGRVRVAANTMEARRQPNDSLKNKRVELKLSPPSLDCSSAGSSSSSSGCVESCDYFQFKAPSECSPANSIQPELEPDSGDSSAESGQLSSSSISTSSNNNRAAENTTASIAKPLRLKAKVGVPPTKSNSHAPPSTASSDGSSPRPRAQLGLETNSNQMALSAQNRALSSSDSSLNTNTNYNHNHLDYATNQLQMVASCCSAQLAPPRLDTKPSMIGGVHNNDHHHHSRHKRPTKPSKRLTGSSLLLAPQSSPDDDCHLCRRLVALGGYEASVKSARAFGETSRPVTSSYCDNMNTISTGDNNQSHHHHQPPQMTTTKPTTATSVIGRELISTQDQHDVTTNFQSQQQQQTTKTPVRWSDRRKKCTKLLSKFINPFNNNHHDENVGRCVMTSGSGLVEAVICCQQATALSIIPDQKQAHYKQQEFARLNCNCEQQQLDIDTTTNPTMTLTQLEAKHTTRTNKSPTSPSTTTCNNDKNNERDSCQIIAFLHNNDHDNNEADIKKSNNTRCCSNNLKKNLDQQQQQVITNESSKSTSNASSSSSSYLVHSSSPSSSNSNLNSSPSISTSSSSCSLSYLTPSNQQQQQQQQQQHRFLAKVSQIRKTASDRNSRPSASQTVHQQHSNNHLKQNDPSLASSQTKYDHHLHLQQKIH